MRGEGKGEYLHLGVGRGSLGEGVGPRIGGGGGSDCVWSGVMGFYEFGIGKGWIGVFEMVLRAG